MNPGQAANIKDGLSGMKSLLKFEQFIHAHFGSNFIDQRP